MLGGPAPIEHRIPGLTASIPRIEALRQLVALAGTGEIPAALLPRERRAARWILELRTADALAAGTGQQALARSLFGAAISPQRWRIESASYRLRVQRLVRTARRRLAAPLTGPWFD